METELSKFKGNSRLNQPVLKCMADKPGTIYSWTEAIDPGLVRRLATLNVLIFK